VSTCVFCAIAAGEKTDQPIVAADEHTVAFLDARPVFKGHVLVIPPPALSDAG
jgi:histidine triad (HIT) family protein